MPALRFKDKDGQAFEAPDELTIQDLFDKVKTTNKDGTNKNVITNSAEHGLGAAYRGENLGYDGCARYSARLSSEIFSFRS